MKTQTLACLPLLLLSIAVVGSFAQEQPAPDPGTSKVEFENDQIRVLRVSVNPHQKPPMHHHPSRFGVTLTKSDLRIYLPDGTSTTSTRPAHQYFWSEPITHQVENLSDAPMQNIEIELERATGRGVEIRPDVSLSKAQGTATDPVAVEQEPHHHVIFENQYVRVLEVILSPGDTTLFHKHALDNVAIQLSDTSIKRQFPGEDWVAAPAAEGSVSFIGGAKTPYVHRINNTGAATFHVFDVEILP